MVVGKIYIAIFVIGISTIVEGFLSPSSYLKSIAARSSLSTSIKFRESARGYGSFLQLTRKQLAHPAAVSSLEMNDQQDISGVAVILLAGGVGSRMKADRPKQFLELEGKPILFHSLDLFLTLSGIISITVVIAEEYRDMFQELKARESRLQFASPGKERQVTRSARTRSTPPP
jgi:hypothetical protein